MRKRRAQMRESKIQGIGKVYFEGPDNKREMGRMIVIIIIMECTVLRLV